MSPSLCLRREVIFWPTLADWDSSRGICNQSAGNIPRSSTECAGRLRAVRFYHENVLFLFSMTFLNLGASRSSSGSSTQALLPVKCHRADTFSVPIPCFRCSVRNPRPWARLRERSCRWGTRAWPGTTTIVQDWLGINAWVRAFLKPIF